MLNTQPIRTWPGTIVLRCPPCSWGKCIFCGYTKDCIVESQLSGKDFLNQFRCYFERYGIPDHLEIYNSGSFLDDKQISPNSRIEIFRYLYEQGVWSVAIESRPEYIRRDNLTPLLAEYKGDLTVCIGLEVADDVVLRKLRKGFSLKDVEKAQSLLKSMGLLSRAYILTGATFTQSAVHQAIESVQYAKRLGFDEISLLAAYPMEGTQGYELWRKGEWRLLDLKEFNNIVIAARQIMPGIDVSCFGLREFLKKSREPNIKRR